MNDHNTFLNLISTPPAALFMGVCITIGVLTSALSMGYYTIFRMPSLFYFSISVVLTYLILGLASQDPGRVLEPGGLPPNFYGKHILSLFGFFFFYKMVTATFHPATNALWLRRTLVVVTAALLVMKVAALIWPYPDVFRAASALVILFLLTTTLVAITHPAKTAAMSLIKAGCTIPYSILLIYPSIRLGILPGEMVVGYMPHLLMGTITLHSVLWFLGLVELARDAREKARTDSRQTMVRTIVQLRDLIESPIEEIEDSVAALAAHRPLSEVMKDMDGSMNRLRLIKAILSRFEKNNSPRSDDETA